MSDLPRLLLCCFDVVPAPTAISRRMTEYLKSLSERYQVVVLSVKTPDHTHIERYQGARLLRVPVGSGDFAARAQVFDRAVRRQLDSEEYVMVHFFDPFGGYALCERRAEFGYKLVYDACSLPSVDLPFLVGEEEANRRFIAKVRRQELFCLMNADVVIVANELTRDFATGMGVPRDQVQVLPAPVDLTLYDPRLMGLPDSTPMKLLHLGNQSEVQDLTTLLEAMQLALQTVDVRLTLLGPKHDEHQARLEEQVAALKLTGKVDFQPPVPHDDLHKVLAAADVGLLTLADVERNSRVGSPLSRLGEYLAAGRPVIAADVAAARAVLPDDGVVLYRPNDKQSLADAIVSLASQPARRVKLGAAARAAALGRDAAKIRADLVAVYVALSGTGVRAVGDADTTSPDEPTQLGRPLAGEDTQRRNASAAAGEPPSGTNKVKTDPAIAAEETSPEASAGLQRPSVMGVPLHEEELPVVLGHEARELAAELAQVSTEPNARLRSEPPVVMGMPLPEALPTVASGLTPGDVAADFGGGTALGDNTPDTGSHLSLVPVSDAPALAADEPLAWGPPATTAPSAPPPIEDAAPPPQATPALAIPPLEMPALPARPTRPHSSATQAPVVPHGAAPPPPVVASVSASPGKALPGASASPPATAIDASPSGLWVAAPRVPGLPNRGPPGLSLHPPSLPPAEEINENEIEEVGADDFEEVPGNEPLDDAPGLASDESVMTVDTDPSPPASAIDPWLAQLVHGYCPPESGLFERHTPPTTTPGRDP